MTEPLTTKRYAPRSDVKRVKTSVVLPVRQIRTIRRLAEAAGRSVSFVLEGLIDEALSSETKKVS